MSLRYVNTVEVLRDNDYEESGGSEDSKHKMRTNIIISEVREYNRKPYYLAKRFWIKFTEIEGIPMFQK